MNIEELREFCLSLKETSEDLPFDERTLVFKVKGKMFALADIDNFDSVNLKCDPELSVELREKFEFVSSGFHMNKKHWITVFINSAVTDIQLKEWIVNSYQLVVAKLPIKDRTGLIS
ncbi:MAG: MmcQ/YjbR family DNA-binding protein [Bacteroidota bacterium]